MSIRILLVEDDEHICNTVKTFLSEAGYKVDACIDGNEAHTRFYENTYQLVILDILLPGMNGHELLREFRKINNPPILMMSALSAEENQIRAFNAEADNFVGDFYYVVYNDQIRGYSVIAQTRPNCVLQ